MGKGSENINDDVGSKTNSKQTSSNNTTTSAIIEECTPITGSGAYYTWSEVGLHNKKDDCWIVVNENVYDLTKFKNKHPGGSRIINHYAGQDASEVFNAFHKEFDKVNKYAKLYHIGRIDPKESKFNKQEMDVKKRSNDLAVATENEAISKEIEMRKDFENLRNTVDKMGLFKPSYTFFILNALHIIFFQITGYYILWKFGDSFFSCLCSLICLVIAQGQSSWIQHDFGHSSLFDNPKYNRLIQQIFLGVIKGASSEWWRYMHNQHHAKPNVIDKDPDVRVDPVFVVGKIGSKKTAKKNFETNKKFLYPYTIQHYFFPLAAAILFPLFFQFTTLKYAWSRKKYNDLAFIYLMFIIHFGITLPAFNFNISKALAFYLLVRLIESSWFTWVSQCNHIVMDIHDDGVYDSWLHLQLKATCNLEKSAFNDWFTGHLNFQIEHHLFPTMPRHNLYKAQPLVQSLCKKHNIKYVVKPMGQAFKDIITSLKKYGDMWQEAYDELELVK